MDATYWGGRGCGLVVDVADVADGGDEGGAVPFMKSVDSKRFTPDNC